MAGKFVGEWDGARRITGRTSHAVAMQEYRNKLYSAYKSWDDHSLWINSLTGSEWAGERSIQGRTSHAPTLAVYHDRLFIAYKGWDGDTLWLNSFDGETWAGEEPIPGAPHDSVALAVYDDHLYVAYNQADHSIWISGYDGHTWGSPTRLIGRTNRGPALGVFDGSLYIAYKGWNNTTLWVNRKRDTIWEGEWRVAGQTNQPPSLAAYRGHLFLSYQGWDDDSIWLTALRWVRWEGEVRIPGRAEGTPTLATFDKRLYLAYRDGDSRIHIDTFDGLGWEGEHSISGTTEHSPAATVYGGEIWVAQHRADNRIGLIHGSDSRHWSNDGLIQGRSDDSPALATWQGHLCVAYKGWDDDSLWVNFYSEGAWAGEQSIEGRTSHAPALTAHNGMLFIAYKGWNNTTLWINHYGKDGDRYVWAGERRVPDCSSDRTPALISFRGKVHLVYRRSDSAGISWRCGYWNGDDIDWETEVSVPGRTSDTPALAAFGDQLFLLYKDDDCHDIYLNVYDKRVGWLGAYNTTLTGGLTDSAPALVCKEGQVYAVYKGWDDEAVWINSYRIPQAWQPISPAGFDPDNPRDANDKTPKCANGQPLTHCLETARLQVFWNESEPDEAVSPSDARLVADTLECAWEIYTNPDLAEGHPFDIDLGTSQYPNPERRSKLPVWISGVTSGNGFHSDYHLGISARGGITGAATLKWGPHGYAGGTGPHELGHTMNKSYSYHFNSGGSGLLWINEGIPDVYRAILDPYYPGTEDAPVGSYESLSPSKLLGHWTLSNGSLLLTGYAGRRFWYDLVRAYTRVHDRSRIDRADWGFYQWREIPFRLRESFRMVAASAGLELVRRLPGRDILSGIQEAFRPCFPEGQRTPTCAGGTDPHPTNGDSGCVPPAGELYRLLPLAMEKIDEALDGYWTRVESPQLPYRAFREYLERNFLTPDSDRTTEAYSDGDLYRLKTLGAHYHVLADDPGFPSGVTLTCTVTPDADLPDREWAVAAFNLDADHLEPIHNWRLGDGVETLTVDTSRYPAPVVIIAGLYLGLTYADNNGDGDKELVSEKRHYDLTITHA